MTQQRQLRDRRHQRAYPAVGHLRAHQPAHHRHDPTHVSSTASQVRADRRVPDRQRHVDRLPGPRRAVVERRHDLVDRAADRALTTTTDDRLARRAATPAPPAGAATPGPAATSPNANFRVRLTWIDGHLPAVRRRRAGVARPARGPGRLRTTRPRPRPSRPRRRTSPVRTAGTLAPQNFWGAMQSQGAPNIQGDAFMT